jgi:hypothetical protein
MLIYGESISTVFRCGPGKQFFIDIEDQYSAKFSGFNTMFD